MNAYGIETGVLGPAFLAGLVVLATHVPLGRRVLARGIVFIDLAIAQIAGLGVVAAHRLGVADSGWTAQASALLAAALGALLLTWTEKRWPETQEALIGALFVLASCVALLLLAGDPNGGDHLKDLLVGQILWVSPSQLAIGAIASLGVLAVWAWAGERLGQGGFYLLFAVAVTVSVQLVGVYLVFASLILPALATRRHARPLARAGVIGVSGYLLGLVLSALCDQPAGPMIVVCMAGVAAIAWGIAPSRFIAPPF